MRATEKSLVLKQIYPAATPDTPVAAGLVVWTGRIDAGRALQFGAFL